MSAPAEAVGQGVEPTTSQVEQEPFHTHTRYSCEGTLLAGRSFDLDREISRSLLVSFAFMVNVWLTAPAPWSRAMSNPQCPVGRLAKER